MLSFESVRFTEHLTPHLPRRSSSPGMTTTSQLPGESDDSCDVLTRCLETFLHEWEAGGGVPQIADHLPPGPDRIRRMVLVELIKVDLEYRCQSDSGVLRLEEYLAEYPELDQPDGMPAELIHEEYVIRNRSLDETISVSDCVARFPGQADAIRRLFDLNQRHPEQSDGSRIEHSWKAGDRVGDFYLMSVLGAGSFGSVFLARQESMQRLVALKISADKGTEAQTLAQLDHPNIVRVYDQVRLQDEQVRLLYMQFVSGGTLHSVVKAARDSSDRTGAVLAECISDALSATGLMSSADISLKNGLESRSWAEVTCQLGIELAQALHYAHEQGILHRDVKPANVLLEANGSARLADFNISFSSAVEGDTAAASFGGSLAYMSPEQLDAFHPDHDTRPDDLDPRCDIYSLGILLWELMYGERPFVDPTDTPDLKVLLDRMSQERRVGPPPTPPAPADATEEMLQAILLRCLQPHREDRYQTASELAQELALCQQPRVARLIRGSHSGWRKLALSWPIVALLLTAIAPHGIAAVFNYFYNDTKLIQAMAELERQRFDRLVPPVNFVAFLIGIGGTIAYSMPVIRGIRAVRGGENSAHTEARLRSLQLSRFVTILGVSEWTVAGLTYPLALHDLLSLVGEVHFFGSFLICGLLAAAYPFFLTATLSIRSFVPALLQHDRLTMRDMQRLQKLADQSGWSLYLAGGVPAVAMMILLLTTTTDDGFSTFVLQALSLLGAAGFAILLSLSRSLEADIEALKEAYRLPNGAGSSPGA